MDKEKIREGLEYRMALIRLTTEFVETLTDHSKLCDEMNEIIAGLVTFCLQKVDELEEEEETFEETPKVEKDG